MIICNVEQGSDEWHKARCGAITASNFSEIRKRLKSGKNKGGFTTAARDYAFRLAIERISGEPLDGGFQTWAMQRGNELEPEARAAHEKSIGTFVEQTGFVMTDDQKFGASADGFIGDEGGSEYKCLVSPERIRSILLDEDLDDFKDQIQGGMWLTGRKWWDFVLYCPALESIGRALTIKRIDRDDNYIADMEIDLMLFDELVEQYRDTLANQKGN